MMRTLYDAFIGVLAASGIDEELGTSHFHRVRRALVRSDIFNIEGANVTPRGLYANDNEMPPTVRAETPEKIDPKILPLVKDFLKCCFPLMKEEPRDNIAEGSFFMVRTLELHILLTCSVTRGGLVFAMLIMWPVLQRGPISPRNSSPDSGKRRVRLREESRLGAKTLH